MFDLYGIPTCGTVKKALAWFSAQGHPHRFHDFRATPPRAEDVRAWVAAFGARAMRNTSGGAFRALGPEKEGWDDARWTEAFLADPMLIKRPIVVRDGVPVQVGFTQPPAI
jgi:arsenate reductase